MPCVLELLGEGESSLRRGGKEDDKGVSEV